MRQQIFGLLLAGASSMVWCSAAQAQDQKPTGGAAAAPANEIVVTGSRVITNGDKSPTPVTVVGVQALQAVQPSTLSDNLNQLPVFAGSRSQYGNPSGATGAANQLNLRNLGANRNLLLFDGHRIPPTLSDGTVDSDMVPQMLIQRVDVVTGGVSAVYGSDAVSGVVNFVPDRKFNGLKMQAQAGISKYGDGAQQDAGIAFGRSLFGGSGHFEASYEYRNDDGVLSRASRPWNPQWSVVGLGTAANPYTLAPNVRLSTTTFGGLITSGVFSGMNFKTNGVLSPFVHGTGAAGSPLVEIGGDGAYYDDSMKAPLRSHQMFARFDQDVSDSIHAYADFAGVLKVNKQYQASPMLSNVTMSSGNAFLAPAYQAQLAAAGQGTFKMSEFMQDAPRLVAESDLNSFLWNAGLEGKLSKYHWAVSYQHGYTQQTSITHNNINQQHLWAALDAVKNPATGQVVCNVTLTNPNADPGCQPLNLFGSTAASSDAINYILADTSTVTHTIVNDAEASFAGSPFSTWAGPVNMAISGEFRTQSLSSNTNAPTSLLADCTGIRYNCTSGATLYQQTSANLAKVSQVVKEVAVEVDAPLLKDSAVARSLSVNGAARYTAYKTSGNYWTWKVGLDWQVTDSLRLRATKSRDIRAPSLNDLYAPQTVTPSLLQDLLTNKAVTVPVYAGGNPNLKAEIGNTITAGVVWKPAPAFSVALDYYNIRITNALSVEKGNVAADQQACYASGGSSPYCELQVRPGGFTDTSAANTVTGFYSRNINLALIKTHGFDLEMNYRSAIFAKPFSARLFANYQPELSFVTPLTTIAHAGVVYDTNSLYPSPKWSATALLHYEPIHNVAIDMMERWRSSMTQQTLPNQIWTNPQVPSFYTTNLNLTWTVDKGAHGDVGGKFDFFLNISNLFDATPPPAAYYNSPQPGQFGGWAIGDDPMGRYFTIGVRWKG